MMAKYVSKCLYSMVLVHVLMIILYSVQIFATSSTTQLDISQARAELPKSQPNTLANLIKSAEQTSNENENKNAIKASASDQITATAAIALPKSKRQAGQDQSELSAPITSDHLETQETGYLQNPAAYHATDSDYNYDAGKNSYGKQASDWSQYEQGNHGLYDKYGDKAWNEQGHSGQSNHGKHDSYGNNYNSHNSGHGSGYYSRDRGYGYEKHYAYDKEVASKQHADNQNSYGSTHGLHDYYGNSASNSHGNHGHDRYGQLSRYGNHGYGKRAGHLGAHHDYGHNKNGAHYYSSSSNPSYSQHSSYQVPTYKSTYSDYSPQFGYPSSYPSYY